MDTKAAFEKWFESREIEMKKNGLGLISIARTKMRDWEAWTASRAAIEIELEPLSDQYFASDIKNSFEHGRTTERKATVQAITSHGIRIKGKTE